MLLSTVLAPAPPGFVCRSAPNIRDLFSDVVAVLMTRACGLLMTNIIEECFHALGFLGEGS